MSTTTRQGAALAAATLLAVFMAAQLLAHGPDVAPAQQRPTLDLLPLLRAAECKAVSSDARTQHATQLEQMAASKKQRSVFVPSDGVQAAKLLSEASLCLSQAGEPAESRHLGAEWNRWVTDLSTAFQSHRLRLDLALQSQRTADALQIHALQALLHGSVLPNPSPLVTFQHWLDAQERQFSAKPAKGR